MSDVITFSLLTDEEIWLIQRVARAANLKQKESMLGKLQEYLQLVDQYKSKKSKDKAIKTKINSAAETLRSYLPMGVQDGKRTREE